ncbi:unnamed protein product [Trypanosoma congolense IL3000]|uniref:WGS project CAEQ00000000 data, annotated contig 2092 n=1 Tax=Trypanosoma congolense (strain IL3000) TaxID=1068625 RepID=F9WBD6_TRYCI|nr:unnamed protein product [Trypanosoma congolense IL3000]
MGFSSFGAGGGSSIPKPGCRPEGVWEGQSIARLSSAELIPHPFPYPFTFAGHHFTPSLSFQRETGLISVGVSSVPWARPCFANRFTGPSMPLLSYVGLVFVASLPFFWRPPSAMPRSSSFRFIPHVSVFSPEYVKGSAHDSGPAVLIRFFLFLVSSPILLGHGLFPGALARLQPQRVPYARAAAKTMSECLNAQPQEGKAGGAGALKGAIRHEAWRLNHWKPP